MLQTPSPTTKNAEIQPIGSTPRNTTLSFKGMFYVWFKQKE